MIYEKSYIIITSLEKRVQLKRTFATKTEKTCQYYLQEVM